MNNALKPLCLLWITGLTALLLCTGSHPITAPAKLPKGIKLTVDTTYVDCPEGMGTALLLNDTYYIFSPRQIRLSARPFFHEDYTTILYLFSPKGIKKGEVNLAPLFQSYFYVEPRHDTLYVSIRGERNYYLDPQTLTWMPYPQLPHTLYEDQDFTVTATHSGEFGSTLYFQDKHKGVCYESVALDPINVCKYKDSYYVANYLGHMMGHSNLTQIEDPRKMTLCTNTRPQADTLVHERECRSKEGTTILMDLRGHTSGPYYDSTLNSFLRQTLRLALHSVFTQKKKLYLLFTESTVTDSSLLYIISPHLGDSIIQDLRAPRVNPIYQFPDNYDHDPWLRFSRASYQQLHFDTPDRNCQIIIEITPSRLRIHTLINTPTPVTSHATP